MMTIKRRNRKWHQYIHSFLLNLFFIKMHHSIQFALIWGVLRYVYFAYCASMQVIPERGEITYVNNKYVENAKLEIKKYNRKGEYVINLRGTTKHVWGNNISIDLYFYEYLHNEYRRSFVEMHFKVCNLINSDPYIGKVINNAGITHCPMPVGTYQLLNMTFVLNDFPNVWPFEKGKVEGEIKESTNLIGKGYIMLIFKQKIVANRKNQEKSTTKTIISKP